MLQAAITRTLVAVVGGVFLAFGLRDGLSGAPGVLLVGVGLGGLLLTMAALAPPRLGDTARARVGSREVAGQQRTGVLLVAPSRVLLTRAAVSAWFVVVLAGGAWLVLDDAGAPDLIAIPLVLLALLFVAVTSTYVRRSSTPEVDAFVLAPDGMGPFGTHWIPWEDVSRATVRRRGSETTSRFLVVTCTDRQERRLSAAVAPVHLADMARAIEAGISDPAVRPGLATGGADAYAALLQR